MKKKRQVINHYHEMLLLTKNLNVLLGEQAAGRMKWFCQDIMKRS